MVSPSPAGESLRIVQLIGLPSPPSSESRLVAEYAGPAGIETRDAIALGLVERIERHTSGGLATNDRATQVELVVLGHGGRFMPASSIRSSYIYAAGQHVPVDFLGAAWRWTPGDAGRDRRIMRIWAGRHPLEALELREKMPRLDRELAEAEAAG